MLLYVEIRQPWIFQIKIVSRVQIIALLVIFIWLQNLEYGKIKNRIFTL